MRIITIAFFLILNIHHAFCQTYYLQPDRVFDGHKVHENWVVVVKENKIVEAGPSSKVTKPRGAEQGPDPSRARSGATGPCPGYSHPVYN